MTENPASTVEHNTPILQDDKRRPGRLRTAGALAALLIVAGGAGGGVGAAVAAGGDDTAAASTIVRDGGSAAPASLTTGSVESAANTIAPSVVTINVTGTVQQGVFGGSATQSDTGSGVIVRSDGYILTNNHVVSAAADGGSIEVRFKDGRTAKATIVGTDPTSDLAVIKASGVSGLTAATFADSDKLHVGQTVLAAGAPLGLSNTVTEGIVSTLHRPVSTGEAGASSQAVIDAVQTDAAINPGNSGGPLVDLSGRVVGINSAIATVSGSGGPGGQSQSGNIGVGFAIPSNDAADVADQLIKSGHATHAQLGISVASSSNGADGATVARVSAGGPADQAGLRTGDLVTKVDDRVVTDADGLVVAVRSHRPGDQVRVTYLRGGQPDTTTVTLASSRS